MNKLELKAMAYDLVLSMNKKQAEFQSLNQQLNEINKQLMGIGESAEVVEDDNED